MCGGLGHRLAGRGEAALLAEVDCAFAGEGALRAALIVEADSAIDCADTALIVWLDSTLGWPDFTVEVAPCETDGANALRASEAAGDSGAVALWAAADCAAEFCGLLRAALILEADGAEDCADAWVILWLFSARAWRLITEELGVVTEGEKELLEPAALAALTGDWAPLAEADCDDALSGLLRAAFILEAD